MALVFAFYPRTGQCVDQEGAVPESAAGGTVRVFGHGYQMFLDTGITRADSTMAAFYRTADCFRIVSVADRTWIGDFLRYVCHGCGGVSVGMCDVIFCYGSRPEANIMKK